MRGVIKRTILYLEKDNANHLDEVVEAVKRVVDRERIKHVIVAGGRVNGL
jgi:hypothetical protein